MNASLLDSLSIRMTQCNSLGCRTRASWLDESAGPGATRAAPLTSWSSSCSLRPRNWGPWSCSRGPLWILSDLSLFTENFWALASGSHSCYERCLHLVRPSIRSSDSEVRAPSESSCFLAQRSQQLWWWNARVEPLSCRCWCSRNVCIWYASPSLRAQFLRLHQRGASL